jgi:AcrR family transcriptional regulator/DNA-binding MarR family transcriptional regulator
VRAVSALSVGSPTSTTGAIPEGGQRRSRLANGAATQRDRLVVATGQLVAEVGSPAIGVHHICQRAGVSRRTFYDLYADRDACFVDAHQEAFGRLVGHVEAAVREAGSEWEDRAVAVTQALLSAWDADRVLAHLCLVAAVGGNGETVALRRTAIAQIAALLADAPAQPLAAGPVLAGAIGSVWELAFSRLTEEPDSSIAELAGTAIYLMLTPFAGRRQAAARAAGRGGGAAYVTRWTPTVVGGDDEPGLLVTELTGQTLRYLSRHPGAANIDIARAVDVRHESQISRHLSRLERAGMVSRRKEGRTNAWVLTARGEEAARTLSDPRADAAGLTTGAKGSANRQDA